MCEEKILSIQEYSICYRVIFKINYLLKKLVCNLPVPLVYILQQT